MFYKTSKVLNCKDMKVARPIDHNLNETVDIFMINQSVRLYIWYLSVNTMNRIFTVIEITCLTGFQVGK